MRLVYLFILFCDVAFCTMFKPVLVEHQIEESSAIIIGSLIGQSFEKDELGMIVTKNTFKISLASGLTHGFLSENSQIDIYTPGGVLAGLVYHVEGAPTFKLDEEVAVFTKKINEKYWIQNLALGKYSIRKIGETKILISEIFPSNPQMGQIEIRDFYRLVKNHKTSFLTVQNNQVNTLNHDIWSENLTKPSEIADRNHGEKRNRVPASLYNRNEVEGKERMPIVWLIFIFLSLIGIHSTLRKSD